MKEVKKRLEERKKMMFVKRKDMEGIAKCWMLYVECAK